MTLSIASITSSGIVLTAESRQTYTNKAGMTRIGTDNAVKLFQLSERAGVVFAGRAFFPDSKGVFKNTGWFIEEFIKEVLKDNQYSIKEIAQKLNDYFVEKFIIPEEARVKALLEQQIKTLEGTDLTLEPRDKLKISYTFKDKDGKENSKEWFIETVNLIVAGYDSDGIGRSYLTTVSEGPTIERNTEAGGPLWIGQTEIIARIMKGWGWELKLLNFIKEAEKQGVKVDEELGKLEYIINWGTMTLQDAVDFNVLMTRITESIQRFSDGTIMNPGGITGVGGYINVATITPLEGFLWINKRDLLIEDK